MNSDKEKLFNLMCDLELLKYKYKFESFIAQKIYSNVGILLEKIIIFVKNKQSE